MIAETDCAMGKGFQESWVLRSGQLCEVTEKMGPVAVAKQSAFCARDLKESERLNK